MNSLAEMTESKPAAPRTSIAWRRTGGGDGNNDGSDDQTTGVRQGEQ